MPPSTPPPSTRRRSDNDDDVPELSPSSSSTSSSSPPVPTPNDSLPAPSTLSFIPYDPATTNPVDYVNYVLYRAPLPNLPPVPPLIIQKPPTPPLSLSTSIPEDDDDTLGLDDTFSVKRWLSTTTIKHFLPQRADGSFIVEPIVVGMTTSVSPRKAGIPLERHRGSVSEGVAPRTPVKIRASNSKDHDINDDFSASSSSLFAPSSSSASASIASSSTIAPTKPTSPSTPIRRTSVIHTTSPTKRLSSSQILPDPFALTRHESPSPRKKPSLAAIRHSPYQRKNSFTYSVKHQQNRSLGCEPLLSCDGSSVFQISSSSPSARAEKSSDDEGDEAETSLRMSSSGSWDQSLSSVEASTPLKTKPFGISHPAVLTDPSALMMVGLSSSTSSSAASSALSSSSGASWTSLETRQSTPEKEQEIDAFVNEKADTSISSHIPSSSYSRFDGESTITGGRSKSNVIPTFLVLVNIARQLVQISFALLTQIAKGIQARFDSSPAWIVLYFVFNLGLTLYNKSVLVRFPFPYTLTALHAFCGTVGTGWLWWMGFFTPARLSARENTTLAFFSVLYTLNIAVSNVSLQLVTIPFHQVVRASAPLFTILIAYLLTPRSRGSGAFLGVGQKKLMALIPVMLGVGFATYGDYYFTRWGLILTVCGTFLAALKTVITNLLQTTTTTSRVTISTTSSFNGSTPTSAPMLPLHSNHSTPKNPYRPHHHHSVSISSTGGAATVSRYKLHPLDLLLRMSPLALIQCIVYAYLSGEMARVSQYMAGSGGGSGMLRASAGVAVQRMGAALFGNGWIAFGLNIVSFTANKRTGPLTMTVAANIKQVLTILLAVVIFDLQISATNILGIVLTLAGGMWYAAIEYSERRKRMKGNVSDGLMASELKEENDRLVMRG